jgi:hypothetical protein
MHEQESPSSSSPGCLSRREALKRGVLLGGTALWVVPAVQVLSISPAAAQQPSGRPSGTRPVNVQPPGPAQGRRFR